jgi:hypothetical protein
VDEVSETRKEVMSLSEKNLTKKQQIVLSRKIKEAQISWRNFVEELFFNKKSVSKKARKL